MLTQKRLKELLIYYPKSGNFRHKINKPGPHARKGNISGSRDYYGYLNIYVDGISYKAHRLAFLYMNGEWPNDEIDHINNKRYDNKWSNLRIVNRSENMLNRCDTNNKSGFLGVSCVNSKFQARLGQKYLGCYSTPEEAYQVYITHKQEK